MERLKTGVIGCGNISGIYFKNLKRFANLELTACADLLPERSAASAKEHGIRAMSIDELLKDEQIKIIVNLTIPAAHAAVDEQILAAGKHVYAEKPLSVKLKDAKKIMDKAEKNKLLAGSAPDTFMGAGIQACRKFIDEGAIGKPVAATAFMMCGGHESWHPDPEFYYKPGGGPLLDMGPYYITALVNLLGPASKVCGMSQISFPERVITSEKKKGTKIKVETPSHIAGVLRFKSGATATLITSFDVLAHEMPNIEIYGSEATLRVPDPNCFGGNPLLKKNSREPWKELPLSHAFRENSRGLGVSDLADSVIKGRPARASGKLAFHVLEIMESLLVSAENEKFIDIKSSCEKPDAMPLIPKEKEETWFDY